MIDYSRYDRVRAVAWRGDHLELLDQRLLPFEHSVMACRSAEAVAQAIHDLVVRGAPAIGIAAAWGVVLAAEGRSETLGREALSALEPDMQRLHAARPTAVNLDWALRRMGRQTDGQSNTLIAQVWRRFGVMGLGIAAPMTVPKKPAAGASGASTVTPEI